VAATEAGRSRNQLAGITADSRQAAAAVNLRDPAARNG